MSRIIPLTAAATMLAVATLATASEVDAPDPNLVEARSIVQEFATTLTGELKEAVQQGGPVNAIKVCQERAPAIAADLSERTGWTVGRTSLKTRNLDRNSPDDWEAGVLADFDKRQAAGEDVKPMAHAEVIETADGSVFRFMKAIPTADLCLACHGSDLTDDVAAALDERYPGDLARGYQAGQVRGAFSLTKPL
ncbi:MAG: DUF3365 domain-containing protein [Sphingobacteriia bacterium]|nr:DUF3365 domain-containing protein [Sphingobacteriia bacterium]NCC38500.1 DUF3365 domain-containing protein [Gammaproteobacteria bacterium]